MISSCRRPSRTRHRRRGLFAISVASSGDEDTTRGNTSLKRICVAKAFFYIYVFSPRLFGPNHRRARVFFFLVFSFSTFLIVEAASIFKQSPSSSSSLNSCFTNARARETSRSFSSRRSPASLPLNAPSAVFSPFAFSPAQRGRLFVF